MALQPDSLVPESVFAGGVCPKPDPTDPSLPTAEICVVYWCVGPVFDLAGDMVLDQVQLKIRPRIINNSRDSLRIDLSNPATVRLLVTGKDLASRWMPPSKTQTAGDRPILVQWNGQTYWAMPPNQPQDAYPTPSGMYTGYATVWDGTFLRAGQSYFKPRRTASNGRAIREGDLVFQIPLDASGDAFIAGLALLEFDRAGVPQVLAIAPRHTWPAPIHPDAF